MIFAVSGSAVSMLHLYGEAGRGASMSSLFEIVLLLVHQEMVDGAEVSVSSLQGQPTPP